MSTLTKVGTATTGPCWPDGHNEEYTVYETASGGRVCRYEAFYKHGKRFDLSDEEVQRHTFMKFRPEDFEGVQV